MKGDLRGAKASHSDHGHIATCRMCYGDEDDDLISPCMCKGTHQYVHRSCLDHWRGVMGGLAFSQCSTCKAQFHLRVVKLEENKIENTQRIRKFFGRNDCRVFLALQSLIGMIGVVAYLVDKDGSLRNLFNGKWERILLRHPIPFYYYIGVLVLFGLVGVFLTLTIAICIFPYDKVTSIEFLFIPMLQFICKHGERCTLTDRLVMCTGVGVAYCFCISMLIIFINWFEPRRIVPKRELIKEYVVEDLSGCYMTPAKLDPQHMERLKKLKLITS